MGSSPCMSDGSTPVHACPADQYWPPDAECATNPVQGWQPLHSPPASTDKRRQIPHPPRSTPCGHGKLDTRATTNHRTVPNSTNIRIWVILHCIFLSSNLRKFPPGYGALARAGYLVNSADNTTSTDAKISKRIKISDHYPYLKLLVRMNHIQTILTQIPHPHTHTYPPLVKSHK